MAQRCVSVSASENVVHLWLMYKLWRLYRVYFGLYVCLLYKTSNGFAVLQNYSLDDVEWWSLLLSWIDMIYSTLCPHYMTITYKLYREPDIFALPWCLCNNIIESSNEIGLQSRHKIKKENSEKKKIILSQSIKV